MRMFEFLQEDISQDMKNIKDIRMLNKVLDADAKALLTQVWNSNSVPIEKKEAYIEMLMDKVDDSQARKDFSRAVGPDVTIPKAKEKVASIGHNQPPKEEPESIDQMMRKIYKRPTSARGNGEDKRFRTIDPDIGPIVRPERTGWEQSKDSGGRSNKGQGPATIDTYDAPGVDLDAFPDGQDDYGVDSADGDISHSHLARPSEPLSHFDGPLVGGDGEETKDTIHRDLDSFSDVTPDYIEDIETEYQNGANPNEIARTLSQTYGLPIASALKIVDNWVNFSTRRGAKPNANAKRIRQMSRVQRNKKAGGRKFYQPKEKEVSKNLNEFHKEYQMAVKKLSEALPKGSL